MKNFHRLLLGLTILLLSSAAASGQEIEKIRSKQFKIPATGSDLSFFFLFNNAKEIFTTNSFICEEGDSIHALKCNPSGLTYAYIDQGRKNGFVYVSDSKGWKRNIKLKAIKPTALCYSTDARSLYVSTNDNRVFKYTARTLEPIGVSFTEYFTPKKLICCPNGYFIVSSNDHHITVRETDNYSARKRLSFDANINCVAFSNDGILMAVLTGDGVCTIYNTRTFEVNDSYPYLGEASACCFLPENKYIAVVTGENRICLINLLNSADRSYADIDESGIQNIFFMPATDASKTFAVSTPNSLYFGKINGLSQNRGQVLSEELDTKMSKWMAQMEGESLEEYALRVNEETRAKQLQMYEIEIATEMADNLLDKAVVSLGNYSIDNGALAIEFSNMPPIMLPIPEDDIATISSPDKLTFSNTQYCLNKTDEFELVYADVLNTETGRSYTYDNRERKLLSLMESDKSMITLDQIKASKMEEMKFEEIKNEVFETAKNQNVLTDHTTIKVGTKLRSSYDALGNSILNYDIDASYSVEKDFSSTDDFKPGKFKAEDSKAAMAMLNAIKKAFESEFGKYLVPGKKVTVRIIGTADASPVNSAIPYDGCYGEYEAEPIHQNNQLTNVSISKSSGITTNEQLAFLRSLGIKDYLEKNVPALSDMKTTFEPEISVSEFSGSQFRRISIKFTFIDAAL